MRFVRVYHDLSTDAGYQFEFCCDRCGSAYRTPLQPSSGKPASIALQTASSLFAALNGTAAAGQRAHATHRAMTHDGALARAIAQAKERFSQCPRCGQWVDDACWNSVRGLCLDCAPEREIGSFVAGGEAGMPPNVKRQA